MKTLILLQSDFNVGFNKLSIFDWRHLNFQICTISLKFHHFGFVYTRLNTFEYLL
jgi:hypothetical protein